MVKPLIYWPSVILKRKSGELTKEEILSYNTVNIVQDIIDTMQHHYGAGLAAIQIGIDKRIIAINAGNGIEVMINPIITKTEGNRKPMVESCLSLPGVAECTMRFPKIYGTFIKPNETEESTFEAEDFRGQAIQHEIEHLDGIVFIDKLPINIKDKAKGQMRRALLRMGKKR